MLLERSPLLNCLFFLLHCTNVTSIAASHHEHLANPERNTTHEVIHIYAKRLAKQSKLGLRLTPSPPLIIQRLSNIKTIFANV